MPKRTRRKQRVQALRATRPFLEYALCYELALRRTPEHTGQGRESFDKYLQQKVRDYLDAMPTDQLPEFRGEETCRWLQAHLSTLCEYVGVPFETSSPLY
jgi:hypothetical protein